MTELPIALLREALSRHGRVRIRVRGQSMRPLIPDGSLVEVVPLDRPALGDVLVAMRGSGAAERLIVHRLVKFSGSRLVLRGDGTLRPDPPMPFDAFLGRVVHVTTARGWQMRLDVPASRCLSRVIAGLRA